jgi:uracil-DNA glycosylase family 4
MVAPKSNPDAARKVPGTRVAAAWNESFQSNVFIGGEQPGDKEDLAGKPFVGPAGRILDQALERAGGRAERCLRDQRGEAFQA